MARRSSFRQRMVSQGRKTFWFSGLSTRVTLAAALSSTIVTSLNAAALALRPFTIVRTRGYVSIFSDQVGASENQTAAYGEIVVSDQALAIGVTAVPTPITDSQSSWHVYHALADHFNFADGTGLQQFAMINYPIDSKAMRKVEEGEDLIAVAELAAISDGCLVAAFTRTLIKLH